MGKCSFKLSRSVKSLAQKKRPVRNRFYLMVKHRDNAGNICCRTDFQGSFHFGSAKRLNNLPRKFDSVKVSIAAIVSRSFCIKYWFITRRQR